MLDPQRAPRLYICPQERHNREKNVSMIEYVTAMGTALTAWKGTDLLKEIYGDALKPGVEQMGKALGGVLGLGNTALFPVHLLNERAKLRLEANLERYRGKLANVSPGNIVEVAPEIGVPLAEKLAYVQDSTLAELYAQLLARASTVDGAEAVHPSFVNIINNLAPDEARILNSLRSRAEPVLPYIRVHLLSTDGSFRSCREVELEPALLQSLDLPQYATAYVENLSGLRLLVMEETYQIPGEATYERIKGALGDKYSSSPRQDETIDMRQCLARTTLYGVQFLSATSSESVQNGAKNV